MEDYKSIYFLGIGGIGMSALALYFHQKGVKVAGYDRTETHITKSLNQIGINVHYIENIDLIPKDIDLVVYTPAIPANNIEFLFLKESKILMYKRSQVLAEIANQLYCVAIAGTHGKTSLSAMLSHILISSKKEVLCFVGGIMKNYNSNFFISKNPQICVVEADEYDKSFLKLYPNLALITAIDADHLDIYHNYENLKIAYNSFVLNIRQNGLLCHSINIENIESKEETFTYGIDTKANLRAENITLVNAAYNFDVVLNNELIIQNLILNYPGKHNIENALGAISLALKLGLSTEEIKNSLKTFSGINRRFEIVINHKDFVFIDDYAHHPKEIDAFINGVRELFPNQEICGIFQPHLFTRTRDFADEFAQSLSKLDCLILLDIYPARELPIEGINSEFLFSKVKINKKFCTNKQNVLSLLDEVKPRILLTIGAGDIDKLVEPIKQKYHKILEEHL